MISGYFIAIILIFSVLLFGSINTWAFAIVGTIIVLFFNGWLYQNKDIIHVHSGLWGKIQIISTTGFIFLCLFQVIPLPLSLIKILSPSLYHLLKEMALDISFKTISVYPYVTINETLKIVVYLMLFIMTASLANNRDAIRKMIVILVVFGFILSCFAIIQKATWNGKIYWFVESTVGSPFGPFVNRNHFAGFMGMVVPLGLWMVFEIRIMEKKLLYLFFSLVMTTGIFLSLSRGGIISFLLSISLFFILTSIRNVKKKSVASLIGFLLILFCYLLYLGISPIIDRFATAGLTDDSRVMVWSEAFEAFKDFPWFGTGLGTFKFVFPMYSPHGLDHTLVYDYAHNDYLQLLLETGVPGVLFMTMFLISIIAIIIKFQKGRKFSPLMAGLTASMSYMIVHSVFDFNLHMPSNAMMFSVILGLIVACSEKSNNGTIKNMASRRKIN